MSLLPPVIEITDAELEALIQRVEQAMAHELALPREDLALLLKAFRQGAHGTCYQIDDTRHRIIDAKPIKKPQRRTGKPVERKGIDTSAAIITLASGHEAVLFQTNRGHAGEWLDQLLTGRPATAPPPIIMSDAASFNKPTVLTDAQYHEALCNVHGRRQFADLAPHFPDAAAQVLTTYQAI